MNNNKKNLLKISQLNLSSIQFSILLNLLSCKSLNVFSNFVKEISNYYPIYVSLDNNLNVE